MCSHTFEHPMSTPHYFSLPLICLVPHLLYCLDNVASKYGPFEKNRTLTPGDAACLLASCSRNPSISACCVLSLALSCLGFHRALRKDDFPGSRLCRNLTRISVFQGCPAISWVLSDSPNPFFGSRPILLLHLCQASTKTGWLVVV